MVRQQTKGDLKGRLFNWSRSGKEGEEKVFVLSVSYIQASIEKKT